MTFETIKYIIEDISIIISAIMLVFTINKTLKLYQDSRYKINLTISYLKRFYLKYYYYLILIPFVLVLNLWYMQLIYIGYLIVMYVIIKRVKQITKLKFTSRITRQYIFIVIFFTGLGTFLMMGINFPELISLLCLFITISPILVLISGALMLPVEKLVSLYYKTKAKLKLKKYQPQIIGITGSCGKTSVKNYLFELIKENKMAIMSPKSYNTVNGLSMTINDLLYNHNSFLILEMGATKVGDIEELVKFTKPNFGIVTEIAPQHISSFKSIDNILNEKMKLIEGLPNDGVAFLNYDNEYIRNYKLKNKCKVITYGNTTDCTYYASEVVMSLEGLSFKVNGRGKSFNVKTKILGMHNINNLLAAIAVCLEFGVRTNDIIDGLSSLEVVKHRLEIRHDNHITIIDDAYNSNPLGFRRALEVLDKAKDYKTLITPGIVDGGSMSHKLNFELAEDIAKVCDEVILVDNESSRHILEGLKEIDFKNIKIVKTYKEGYQLVKQGTVLVENDLTDNYFL